jgi:GTPase SAR1 family protein
LFSSPPFFLHSCYFVLFHYQVVGQANVGKSALVRCLKELGSQGGRFLKLSARAPSTISTDGIEINTWEPKDSSGGGDEPGSEEETAPIQFSVWDFAGQEVYYNTHQFFLTNDSITIIVFNLVDQPMAKVEYWLQSIQSRAPHSPIILIGTHTDHKLCTKELLTTSEHHISAVLRPHFSQIRAFIPVSCKTRKNVDALQSELLQVGREKKVRFYPRSFLQLEDIIRAERVLQLPPIMTITEFSKAAMSCGIDEKSCKGVAEFLCNLGVVVYWNNRWNGLDDLVVLDPQARIPLFSFFHNSSFLFSLFNSPLYVPSNFLLLRLIVVGRSVCNARYYKEELCEKWNAQLHGSCSYLASSSIPRSSSRTCFISLGKLWNSLPASSSLFW